jgi:predicted flap endonuclease-1-like 5' DNA nuclease
VPWTSDIRDPTDFRREAERALTLPLGMVNPFWLIFGAAATAGVTWWWWMNRLARAADVEAARESAAIYEMAEATPATTPIVVRSAKAKKSAQEPVDAPAEYAEATEAFANPDAAGMPRVALDPVVPPEARTATYESEIPAESSETPGAAGYPIVAPGPEAEDAADDFTQLAGVGPRIAAGLVAHGVTRFSQLASWTADQIAAFDQEMNLRGRAIRSDWVEQARRLAAE